MQRTPRETTNMNLHLKNMQYTVTDVIHAVSFPNSADGASEILLTVFLHFFLSDFHTTQHEGEM